MNSVFVRLVELAARRPRQVIGVAIVVSLLAAALALWRLEPSGASDQLTGRGSAAFQATERYRERFGDHSIVVLVTGDLSNIVLTDNLGRLTGLEGCLSGNQPKGVDRRLAWRGSPCSELARTKPVQVVYGPGTFINSSFTEIEEQLGAMTQQASQQAQQAGEEARRTARRRGASKSGQDRAAEDAQARIFTQLQQQIQQIATRYGMQLGPQMNVTDLIATIVFDPARGANVPKARFAFLFPNQRSAVIQARLKPGLSESERRRAIALVHRAVAMDRWKLGFEAKYTVTGAPIVIDGLSRSLTDALWLLLLAAVLVMAAVLALVFRSRLRLLPLLVALAATACVFGAMAVLGIGLTMASIAVLPVLVGLAVDYAIQYQARVDEERERGSAARDEAARALAARAGPTLPPVDPATATAAAARRAARVGAPTIATAALATAVGFCVLLAPWIGSPVPMVRGFALLLVLGIAIAFALALTAGTAALVAIRPGPREGALAQSGRGAVELLAAVVRVPARLLAPLGRFLRATGRRVLRLSLRRPGRVLIVAFALALGGWVLDSQTEVTSDLNQLVPQDLQAVRDVNELQRTTGISGEIDVLVEGRDLTEPEVVQWMREYKAGLLRRYRYSTTRGCGAVALCPALSLPDLFRTPQAASSRERIRELLDAVPAYFSQAVISRDRRTAIMAFGIKLLPFEEQQKVIDEMRRRLNPPSGVRAAVAGLPVLAAQAHRDLSNPWRRMGTLLGGLLAVGLALWLLGRRRPGALLALVPIALATGWSALVLFATRVPLNPMSATLGVLVIAISTEFSVLLSARYRQERAAGLSPQEALARTYRSTGAAVLASGATAIAGFAVLAASDITMLREFGIVTVVDLAVSLLGVLAVLPAVLMLAERRAGTDLGAAPDAVDPPAGGPPRQAAIPDPAAVA